MNWTLLHDTRVRSPASPVPEPVDVCVGGQDIDWDDVPPLHHQQPASDLCLQVMQREPPCGTQPLTSASKSSDESPAASQPASPVRMVKKVKVVLQPASPVRLVKPVKVVLQRLVVELPVPQVLRLSE